MRPGDVINVQMCKKCERIDNPLSGNWVSLSDKQSDQSDSSVEHSQFIFYLYDHVEYLAQRCDYATGWSASLAIIKEDISDEKNRFVFFGTRWIDRTKL